MITRKPIDHGLTQRQSEQIDDLVIDLDRVRHGVVALGTHHTYSRALTNIEEAKHWLTARKTSEP